MRRTSLVLALLSAGCWDGRDGKGSAPFAVVASDPAPGSTEVLLNAVLRFRMSGEVDPGSVGSASVAVTAAQGSRVPGTVSLEPDGRTISFAPAAPFAPDESYSASLAESIVSSAGKPLPSPFVSPFTTISDADPPSALLAPAAGAVGVPTNGRVVAVFSEPIDPSSVGAGTLVVSGPSGNLQGPLTLAKGNRVLRFNPAGGLPPNATISVSLAGGPGGPRDLAGNPLPQAVSLSFATGTTPDFAPPSVALTANQIPSFMNAGLRLPAQGFTLDVSYSDDRGVDPGSLLVAATVPLGPPELPAVAPGSDLFEVFEVGAAGASGQIPARLAFPDGEASASAAIEDLAGNASATPPLVFTAGPFPDSLRPFEEIQRVFVDLASDRGPIAGGNGVADLEDDLLAYGLATAGDPIGTNAVLRERAADRILEVASFLLEAAPGARIELTTTTPPSPFTSICVGGIDPADPGRQIGDPTTGVVGRAWFDLHNADLSDHNCSTDPPLGVFPGEIFIALGNSYLAVAPGGTILFGQTYAPLAPAFGGTPAGTHPQDPAVLAPGFDPSSASPAQMARFLTIALAIDRLGRSAGAVLAHELGHSFGLTATGPPPGGLFGTATKHNQYGSALDVMLASFAWENLVILPIRFRPMNLAYLRERLVLE